ncbi:MAG: glycogen/starch/alpha-glucan phosphorylase [Oscillospiraceae bacterium]|nr:glycogen/starch/alpha-glucan phosphorylase [Oscillospiraceae bacterium]
MSLLGRNITPKHTVSCFTKKKAVLSVSNFKSLLEAALRGQENHVCDLYVTVSQTAMKKIEAVWGISSAKKVCYFSAEFLVGRVVYSNLQALGVLEDMREVFRKYGLDANLFEDVEDAALGNGGLGRLAACFLDSAATMGLRMDGYGIRYRYGLFKQHFHEGFQRETADDWTRFGDPWSIRREKERIQINFGDQSVWAIPYDMPVIGYGGKTVNTLRLWQSEPMNGFNFSEFDEHTYNDSYAVRNAAEAISGVLYPNDDTDEGKRLRLKQQYFFASASLQSMLREYRAVNGSDYSKFSERYAIQLNDTHPTVAIPEFLRLLMEDGVSFEDAFSIALHTFAYTNHTVMAEALEKWDVSLFCFVAPAVYPYVVMIQNKLTQDLHNRGINGADQMPYYIVDPDQRIHMTRMAVYATHSTNGVAALHTEILKHDVLKEWHALYPERFSNKTNGITQRRWLSLCNPKLAGFITERIGDGWITDLDQLERLRDYERDHDALWELADIKRHNKLCLAEYVCSREHGVKLNPDSIFDIQVKRLHEYKRQLLNAFSILDIYFQLKDGCLSDFYPMTFLFGAKAAPGYRRAKAIIKVINEVAELVNRDSAVMDTLKVVFVQNYNVSYAEKLIPAADISEQISPAGTEASGTGNMKFMLNGAVTLGTYDGANVEIAQQAGHESNYIFGSRVEQIREIKDSYHPRGLYEASPGIRRVLDTLIDGTLNDNGTGLFRELFDSLLHGHNPDQYYLLLDFESYMATKLQANRDYRDRLEFSRKCLHNTSSAGIFSSDRTIREYAADIWHL